MHRFFEEKMENLERSENVTFRLNRDELKKLKILSMRSGQSQSGFLRKLVNQEFSRTEKNENFEEKIINELSSLKTKIDVTSLIGLMHYIDRIMALEENFGMQRKPDESPEDFKKRHELFDQKCMKNDLHHAADLMKNLKAVLDE
jgi:thioredoxin-like negative regulator of GroEL